MELTAAETASMLEKQKLMEAQTLQIEKLTAELEIIRASQAGMKQLSENGSADPSPVSGASKCPACKGDHGQAELGQSAWQEGYNSAVMQVEEALVLAGGPELQEQVTALIAKGTMIAKQRAETVVVKAE